MSLTVRVISPDEHRRWIAGRHSVSFLQLPEWGVVKAGWRHESLGWFRDGDLVGAGLLLRRLVPRVPSRSLAYLPEGPDIDWLGRAHPDLTIDDWLRPLLDHCRAAGAFQVKLGPPVAARRWQTPTVKAAMAAVADEVPGAPRRISAVDPDWAEPQARVVIERLRAAGWRQPVSEGAGFGDMQPRYVFQVDLADKTPDDLLAGFNQLWRRNIKKSAKAGVVVERGGFDDLPGFHAAYLETAERDGFPPRGLHYFQHMWTTLNAVDPDRLTLYLARHDGQIAAATLMVVVGDHAWYSYGASTTASREVRPSNAVQWRMMLDALQRGCRVYDLRGIADTLDPADHLHGLVQFKVGTGGYVQELLGEWDFVLRPLWAKALQLALR